MLSHLISIALCAIIGITAGAITGRYIIPLFVRRFKKKPGEPRWDKPTWSGRYFDINKSLEDEEARKGIRDGAIQELINRDFVRIVKVNGEQKIEYSDQFIWLLKNDKDLI